MAEEVDKKRMNDSAEQSTQPVLVDKAKDTDGVDNNNPQGNRPKRRGLVIGLVVLAVLALGLIGAAGFVVLNSTQQHLSERSGSGIMSGGMHIYDRSGFGRGRTVQTEVNDSTVTTTVYNYLTGVVVAVNSDNIVVAGNGKQTTIKTNSSTSYTNDTKPVVNDSVTIAGTTADNVITATQIAVANR